MLKYPHRKFYGNQQSSTKVSVTITALTSNSFSLPHGSQILKRSDMKKLTSIFAMLVLALTVCTGHESKQSNGVPPMTTEEKEVYSAY